MNSEPVILKNPQSLDHETLRSSDLLEIQSQDQQFTKDEIQAVRDFLEGGGAVLVVIDEERRTPLLSNGVNELIAPYGLRFTADTPYLHNCGALAKAGLIHTEDREIPYSGGRAIVGGTPFAWRLDEGGQLAEPFGAYAQVDGGGRIVGLSELMAYLGMGTKEGVRLSGVPRDPSRTTYWGKDAQIFLRELRQWLTRSRSENYSS